MDRRMPDDPASPRIVPASRPSSPLRVQTDIGLLAGQHWRPVTGRLPPTVDAGRLPRVLLVHGMFGSSDVWAATALNLARSGLEVLSFDLPGHGGSTAWADSPDAVVRAFLHVLQQGWADRPLLLVGHSFGTLVATRLLAALQAAGQAVHGLVLLSPLGLGAEVNRPFLLDVIEARDDAALARALDHLTVRKYRSSPAYLSVLRQRLLASRDQLYVFVDATVDITGQQTVSLIEPLAAATVPVTLVHGQKDAIFPWQHALAAPPQVALHLPPAVGHMPHWEASTLVDAVLRRAAGLR